MGAEGGGLWQPQQVYRSVSVPQALLRIAQEEGGETDASLPSSSIRDSRQGVDEGSAQRNGPSSSSGGRKRLSLKAPLLGSFKTRRNHVLESPIEEETLLGVAEVGSPEDTIISSCDSTVTRIQATTTRSTSLQTVHVHSNGKNATGHCSCCQRYTTKGNDNLIPPPFPGHDWPAILDDAASASSSVFYDCVETAPAAGATQTCHRALMTPDILNIILQKVDDMNIVPHEISQQRRKPMSLRHALLIYGDTSSAKAAWREAQKEEKKRWEWMVNNPNGGLHSCLLVSRLWYQVASDILYDKVHFKSQKAWNSFLENSIASHGDERLRSSVMVLHKIKSATQDEIDLIGSKVGGNLKWLEFYTCPSIVPGPELLAGEKVTKVVLAGCSRVDDRTLSMIAHNCPRLQHLDLRACDLVSDHGLKKIARYCPDLRLLNVGRTERGERVTYKAIKHLARRTSIQTLGLAGCHVDDRAMWELALHRGPHLQRLSLNDCRLLTNFSIPRILVYMPNLSVLELRACEQITDMRPIVQFKRYRELQGHPPLIEGCEVIELRMKEAEWLLEVEASRRIIADCLEWIYSADSDVDNAEYCHSPASIVVVS